MKSAHYRGRVDGDIKEYLIWAYENKIVSPSFVGFEPFQQLWDMGVIYPGIASVRLYFSGKSDEHYVVADEHNLEGVRLMAHSGKSGLHNTRTLLSTTDADCWYAENLDPRAHRR